VVDAIGSGIDNFKKAQGEKMILDPTSQFIRNITEHCDIKDSIILEVGCGKGRVTEDLARYAGKITAIDPDEKALAAAKSRIAVGNVEFVLSSGETLNFPGKSFDIVIYSLSLHHIPIGSMKSSLEQATVTLREKGKIIVIEPGTGGTLIEAEERFGVGDSDEKRQKAAAEKALDGLEGWEKGETIHFQTFFYFESQNDFLENLAPRNPQLPEKILAELEIFLNRHFQNGKIVLNADRRMNVFTRRKHCGGAIPAR
jgi:ubiquinone/menaquinone biosynthesis C-methylase UbiE